jgi:hypothetical protein
MWWSADIAGTGLKEMWTGERTPTVSRIFAGKTAEYFGAGPEGQRAAGDYTEAALSAVALGTGFLRPTTPIVTPKFSPAATPAVPFKSGDIIYKAYQTPAGTVEMMAEVEIQGSTLHLKNLAVYPKGTQGQLAVGMKEVLRMRKQLMDEAKALGFDELRLSGQRVESSSSANPGKMVDETIDLNKK